MKTKVQIISDMCLRWNHSYGLIIDDDLRKRWPFASGFTMNERKQLYRQMEDLYEMVESHITKVNNKKGKGKKLNEKE